jgi:uncharacterized protein (DUF58 family)
VPRPQRPLVPVSSALALSAAWFLVAHEGGSGWVQLLGDVVWGALLVGLLGGALAGARAKVSLEAAPGDAVAGSPVVVEVRASTRLRITPLEPPGPAAFVGRRHGEPDAITLVPLRRGVHQSLTVELASAAPFGMLWWRRRVRLSMPGELVVAPRLGEARPVDPVTESGEGGLATAVPADVGEPRGVRDYQPGDHRRFVHWPATAHRGDIAVKEMETPAAEPAVVRAELPAEPDAAEREAERVLGSVVAFLAAGRPVTLVTLEADGARLGPVPDRRAAGRRLARAVSGSLGAAVGSPSSSAAAAATSAERGAGDGRAGIVVDGDGSTSAPSNGHVASVRGGGLMERLRRANRPGPAEDAIALRVACAGSVLVAISAVHAEGEISGALALVAGALLVTGMVVSYRTRRRPRMWVKAVLAAAAVVAFAWFFHQLSGQQAYDIATVENPLAELFVAVQVIHSFDVPARRDLSFSLAGSAVLLAVAAAQATTLGFGLFALAWMVLSFTGLCYMWASAAGGGPPAPRAAAGALGALVLPAVALLLVLPAPTVGGHIVFPVAGGSGGSLSFPFSLAGDRGSPSEPARAGSPADPIRVGGFTGFASRLNTALRGSLGKTVVMRVRAQRPSYWVGETFDTWNGVSWLANNNVPSILGPASPFMIPSNIAPTGTAAGSPQASVAQSDLQTFYVVQSTPNLVFHADDVRQVWFPTHEIFVRANADAVISPIGLGSGAIYTVRSDVSDPDPAELRAAGSLAPASGLTTGQAERDVALPHTYPRAATLAAQVTAGAANTYDKVELLIDWLGTHTTYTTDIPPLAPGADTVNAFLFGDRRGFCEQISTALAVMLRSEGIPAREAVGYVPGPYNPITDLYEVQARDAHAWVQVWFPGYGWQSFDPTAVVPAANPSPGGTLLRGTGRLLGTVPSIVAGSVLVLGILGWLSFGAWRRRPAGPAEAVARRMERAGGRAGRPRAASETLSEYAAALEMLERAPPGTWRAAARTVEAAAYGDRRSSGAARAALERWRAPGRRRRRDGGRQPARVGEAGRPGPRRR